MDFNRHLWCVSPNTVFRSRCRVFIAAIWIVWFRRCFTFFQLFNVRAIPAKLSNLRVFRISPWQCSSIDTWPPDRWSAERNQISVNSLSIAHKGRPFVVKSTIFTVANRVPLCSILWTRFLTSRWIVRQLEVNAGLHHPETCTLHFKTLCFRHVKKTVEHRSD